MSDILISNNEPVIKIKKQLSEKQLLALKKGRENAALKAKERKLQKENSIKPPEPPEPLENPGEILKEEKIILENPGEISDEDDDDDEEELETPQPLLKPKQPKQKKEKKEKVIEVKLTPKERLAQMRLQKKLELEEKKLELEELKMNKMIEEENKKIEQLKTTKQEENHDQSKQHSVIFTRPTTNRIFGSSMKGRHF
jgi:hypothetical protein